MRACSIRGRKNYVYLILLIISCLLLNIGCSENLTNEKAQKIIIAATKYPLKRIGSFEISPSPDQGVLITPDKMPDYIKMMANKLISMNIRGISKDGSEYYDVKLTDEGKRFVLQEVKENDKLVIKVLLGELIFDKIINIRKEPDKEIYNVNYSEEVSKLTPFGACLINKAIYEKTIGLVLSRGKW